MTAARARALMTTQTNRQDPCAVAPVSGATPGRPRHHRGSRTVQPTRRSHRRCQGVSTARGWWCARTQATAGPGGNPSSTARAASTVPVRPTPPRQATSTRWPAYARRHASRIASSASAGSRGTQKSGQRTRRCGQAGAGPGARSRAKSAGPAVGAAIGRARTAAPPGSTTSPLRSVHAVPVSTRSLWPGCPQPGAPVGPLVRRAPLPIRALPGVGRVSANPSRSGAARPARAAPGPHRPRPGPHRASSAC